MCNLGLCFEDAVRAAARFWVAAENPSWVPLAFLKDFKTQANQALRLSVLLFPVCKVRTAALLFSHFGVMKVKI